MELAEAIRVVDQNRHWIYKQATDELEQAITVIWATAKVVLEERERIAAQRRDER